nr:uncharacterized protein LOC116433983 [Nomia melanderi]XP_031848512.1 uncharacterized protein LOC116433983 [Nomia melanderi]XP_031848513.1 uncharacterized protein LOC116433983 [Nomia melanderi]
MKRATNASAAAATAGSQMQQPAVSLQGRIHDLFNPITAAVAAGGSIADRDEREKIAESKPRTEPSKVPSSKGGSSDDTKAKSTAMSRLLAVDADNYMLRKGAGSNSASTVATSISLSTIAPSSATTNQANGGPAAAPASYPSLRREPRPPPQARAYLASNITATNAAYNDFQMTVIYANEPQTTESIRSRANLPLPAASRRYPTASQPTHPHSNASSIAATYSSSYPSASGLTSAALMNGNATLKHRVTNRPLLLMLPPLTAQTVTLAREGHLISPEKVYASGVERSDEPVEKHDETFFVEKTTDAEHERLWRGCFPCARPASFHRYMCFCKDGAQLQLLQQQQQHRGGPLYPNNIGGTVLSSLLGGRERAEGGVDSYAIGHEGSGAGVGQRALLKGVGSGAEQPATDRTYAEFTRFTGCCCMCGSICPTECHACFHVVCSEYNGQHLCQWSSKGHALPGQVLDKDKVSTITPFL